MKFENVSIASVIAELPPNVVTTAQLEEQLRPCYERLSLPFGRLELMTGIKERRFWNPGETPSSIATRAGERAIEQSGIDRSLIGAVIHASVCRDFLEPATANVVHNNLGLPNSAVVYDISNACLGVLNGMVTIANMISLGQIEAGLVVSGEMGETLVNSTVETLNTDLSLTRQTVKPAFASLTIASAGAAVLLTRNGLTSENHKLLGGVVRCATQHNHLCRSTTADGGINSNAAPLMDTDAEALLYAGCDLAAETFPLFTQELGWQNSDIDHSFTHQVGLAHRNLLYQKIGLETEKDFPTLEFMGNTGSAALPSAFGIGIEKNVLQKGDKAALLGIGSGLNSIMLGVKW